MLDVLELTLPIFGLILVGYLSGRTGLLGPEGVRGLSRFAFRVAIPVMLARAMAHLTFTGPIEWNILLAYYCGAFVVYGFAMALSGWVWSYTLAQKAVFGLGASFANLVVLGVPLVLLVEGAEGELPLYMVISLNSAVLLFVATALVGFARGQENGPLPLKALGTQIRNPIVLGLGVGLTLNLLDVPIFEPVDQTAGMLAAAAPTCALFALGASLSLYRFGGRIRETVTLVILKNAIHPTLVYVMAFLIFDLPRSWAVVAVILAAQPIGVNVYLFAEDSGLQAPTVGGAFLLSTLASIGSVPLVLYLLS